MPLLQAWAPHTVSTEPCSPTLQARAAAGFPPDPFTYSALISGFGKANRLGDALQALQDACNEQVLNLVVFNAALDACQRCRDPEVRFYVWRCVVLRACCTAWVQDRPIPAQA